jgi:hypothetical protein
MAAKKKMLIVTDPSGKIVAAAHLDQGGQPGMSAAITPLPGQTVHEVEVPGELARLTSGPAFHSALSQAQFTPGTGKLKFKPVTWKKVKH